MTATIRRIADICCQGLAVIVATVRADRLLALLLLLQARGRTTAAALADELEVSVRTIYRDLEALSIAGVPVFTESGPRRRMRAAAGYRSPLDGADSSTRRMRC